MKITKGKTQRAVRCVIYGAEGIGKSTLGSQFPEPVFIDLEEGTSHMDVARIEDVPKNFTELIALIKEIAAEPSIKSLILDTADKAEQLAIADVCVNRSVKSIEDIGYGKGYTYVADNINKLLSALDDVVGAGKNVCVLAHAQMRKFEQPDEMGAYDRWELKLSKKSAPLVKEWADVLLFCNYKTMVVTDDATKSKKARGGKRVMYATHNPCWDAKNRFGLPDQMDMNFSEISHIFSDVVPVNPLMKLTTAIKESGIDESAFKTFVADKTQQCSAMDDIAEWNSKVIAWANKNFEAIINKLKEN